MGHLAMRIKPCGGRHARATFRPDRSVPAQARSGPPGQSTRAVRSKRHIAARVLPHIAILLPIRDRRVGFMNRREFVRLAGGGMSAGTLAEAVVSAQVAKTPATPAGASPKAKMKVGTQHGDSDE